MIPGWLQEKLASVPTAGAGIHAWLFSVSRQLHAHMPPQAVVAALMAATTNAGRRVTAREIRDAVQNSHGVAWKSTEKKPASVRESQQERPDSHSADSWPESDPVARYCRVKETEAEGVSGIYDLWERSPAHNEWTADDWLDWLFPGAEWLCLAKDHPATARSRKPEKWYFGAAEECGLVVPSPMIGPSGKGLDGRTSHRCLDNTGPRRWLVIEFDKLKNKTTDMPIDQQAALHWHFRSVAAALGWPPLRLCVHSAGKSLHGWFGPVTDEEAAFELMAYAVSLGADPATWNRCQLVRLPGGTRTVKPREVVLPDGWEQPTDRARQEVIYFEPEGSSQLISTSIHAIHE